MERYFSQPRMMAQQNHFARTPNADIQRSVFNRTHQHKTTFDAGYLIPIYTDEMLPGDAFKMRCTTFARLATPIAPFMDNLYADIHFWFVPNRLLWEHWEAFCGAQDPAGAPTEYIVPTINMSNVQAGTLFDYFGIPTGILGTFDIAAFHSRAYNLIWNTWYRSQFLQTEVVVDTDDGPDNPNDYVLLRRNKRHDYFTSCLPWPQSGTAVSIPLEGIAPVAPVMVDANGVRSFTAAGRPEFWHTVDTTNPATVAQGFLNNSGAGSPQTAQWTTAAGTPAANDGLIHPRLADWGANTNYAYLAASLDDTSGLALVTALRDAFQIQRMLERDARGGLRYVELLKSHFNVVSPDFRLQRPEYLGGGTVMVNTSPIAQTSSTDATTPQGNLAAVGTFSHSGVGFNYAAQEHGVVLGILSVRADLTYQQGLNRMWTRSTRYDYYWPTLAHITEQAVLSKEIYVAGNVNDDDVFGYQEAYADYRYKPSQITGLFRSTVPSNLDYWHLAQEFSSRPVLNSAFIIEDPPVDRVIAVPGEPHFLLDCLFELKCARPMPVYSVPGLADHF